MTEENKKQINLSLLLPSALLLLEVIIILVLRATGFKLPQHFIYFFALLGIFLVYQIGRQLITRWRIKHAIMSVDNAENLVSAGRAMEAIKVWKRSLFKLPEEKFLSILERMEEIYKEQGLKEGVQQVEAIHSESVEFFKMTKYIEQPTNKDQQNLQARAYELQKMIQALPVEKNPDHSESKPEEK